MPKWHDGSTDDDAWFRRTKPGYEDDEEFHIRESTRLRGIDDEVPHGPMGVPAVVLELNPARDEEAA